MTDFRHSQTSIYHYHSPLDGQIYSFQIQKQNHLIVSIAPTADSVICSPQFKYSTNCGRPNLFNTRKPLPLILHLGYINAAEKLTGIPVSDYTYEIRNIIFLILDLKYQLESIIGFGSHLAYSDFTNFAGRNLNIVTELLDFLFEENVPERWLLPGGLSKGLRIGFYEKLTASAALLKKESHLLYRQINRSLIIRDRLAGFRQARKLPILSSQVNHENLPATLITGNILSQIQNRFIVIQAKLEQIENSKNHLLLNIRKEYSCPEKIIYPKKSETLQIQASPGPISIEIDCNGEELSLNYTLPFQKIWERISCLILDLPVENLDLFIASINPSVKGFFP